MAKRNVVPKLNVYIKPVNQKITEKIVEAECKSWGLNYPPKEGRERSFIWEMLSDILRR